MLTVVGPNCTRIVQPHEAAAWLENIPFSALMEYLPNSGWQDHGLQHVVASRPHCDINAADGRQIHDLLAQNAEPAAACPEPGGFKLAPPFAAVGISKGDNRKVTAISMANNAFDVNSELPEEYYIQRDIEEFEALGLSEDLKSLVLTQDHDTQVIVGKYESVSRTFGAAILMR